MTRIAAFLYGLVCYVIFLGVFLYSVGFVANVVVPKGVDSGPVGGTLPALIIDALLLTLFAVQHSVMARPAFKRWWRRIVPHDIERSTYVLASSVVLAVLFWRWRPLPSPIWEVSNPAGAGVLWAACTIGWAIVLCSTFMISHAHLFGLAQVWARLSGRSAPEPEFQTRWFYRFVRHPLILGFFIAFWATPRMTVGHLVFAAASTGYMLLATLAFEERDLARYLGEPYRRYRDKVRAFIPYIGPGVRTEDFLPQPGEVPGSEQAPGGR